jgi:hypothetical protein
VYCMEDFRCLNQCLNPDRKFCKKSLSSLRRCRPSRRVRVIVGVYGRTILLVVRCDWNFDRENGAV